MSSQKMMPLVILGLGAVLAGGVLAANTGVMNKLPKPSINPTVKLQTASFPSDERISVLEAEDQLFADIADEIAPSVVHVKSEQAGGEGSGFVYTSDGWIVTNDHVVGGAESVKIVLNDGRELDGKVYSTNDAQLDLALIKIDASGLKALALADSDTVRTGQRAIAAGSPFGLEKTVTIGHVSATNRSGLVMDPRTGSPRSYKGMIQTDASINPGNSGGPLLNVRGQVIGVNSTIYSLTGSSAGVGFAIPSDTVKVVADEIVKTGKFDRGVMGIDLDSDDIKPYRLQEMGIQGGALASRVSMDGPAFKAGIRDNDVITAIDGKPVMNQTELLRELYARSPGQTVKLDYQRGKDKKAANFKLANLNDLMPAQEDRQPQVTPRRRGNQSPFPDFFPEMPNEDMRVPQTDGKPRLGIGVEDVTAEARNQYNLPSDVKGAVILSVTPGSVADRFRMKVGDVIQSLDGKAVTSAADLTRIMQGLKPGQEVMIDFIRFSEGTRVNQSIQIQF